jgi:hypothetical protein
MSQTTTIGTHRTTVSTDDNNGIGVTRVTYHSTNVVTFDNYHIQLQSGGWHTPTTKLRMNQTSSQYGLGFHVSQRNFDWYVTYKGAEQYYTDGMILIRTNRRLVFSG